MKEYNKELIEEEEEKEEEVNLIKEAPEKKDKDKERLVKILDRVKNRLDNNDKETIIDVYLKDSEEQLLKGKEKKNSDINKCSNLCYKFTLFLITTIILTGSFIIVSLKKSFWNLFISSIKCYAEISCDEEEFIKRANFFEYFLEQLLREPIDLNLIMFWNMIGLNLMNSIGFRCTSILFMVFNSLIFLATYNIGYDNYDPQTCKYSFIKIIALFFNWVAMVFCFGGSSLLAQQKFIDYYSLFDYKISEEELETSYKQLLTEMVTINKPNDINNNNIKADGTNNNTTNNIDNNDINKKKEEQKEKDIKEELEKKSEDKRKKILILYPFLDWLLSLHIQENME